VPPHHRAYSGRAMPRPPREDRSNIKDVVLTLKVSKAERALLDRLAAARAAELAKLTGERTTVTVGRYLRWLMMRDAEARGMSPDDDKPQDMPPKTGATPASAEPAPRKKPSIATKAGPKRG
jgi:hypothetical protein